MQRYLYYDAARSIRIITIVLLIFLQSTHVISISSIILASSSSTNEGVIDDTTTTTSTKNDNTFQSLRHQHQHTTTITTIAITAITKTMRKRTLQQMDMGQIDKFRLINSDTDIPILDLVEGMILNLATLPTINFNIQATVSNGTVGSVVFGYNNIPIFRTEYNSPYSFCGDAFPLGNYFRCSRLIVGQHTITATPFTNATGGIPKRVSFRIVNIPLTCNVPQFVDTNWTLYTPNYPIETSEPMGVIIGNDFVAFGGFINIYAGTTNETYARNMNETRSTWRRMDDIPIPIAFTHAPVVRVGTRVYMCGGYLGAHPGPHSPYCFMYDHSIPPGTGQQWTRISDLPNNGYAGGGMIYDTTNNALYFAGGGQRLIVGSIHPIDSNRAFKYSLDNPSDGWTETTPIPYTANHLSSVTQVYNGKEYHYFFGGQFGEYETNQNLPNMYEFIAATETWIPRTFMPGGRGHTTASTRPIGCGFITAGGSLNSVTTKKNRTNTILYYDIPTGNWTYIGNLSVSEATPLVDIQNSEYMYYVNSGGTSRRRLSV